METIKLHDKEFTLLIKSEVLDQAILNVSKQISHDLKECSPIFVSVLNGAFMFTSDLVKHITIPDAEISFIKICSYQGVSSTGNVKEIMGLNTDIKGRCVVIVEDLVDSGRSMEYLIQYMKEKGAARIVVCSMFFKPKALIHDVKVDYYAMELNNDFVVGRGLDYDGLGRFFPDLYILKE